ncbi:hypothetical protein [Vibrio agarivorans]|uniref:hypothetical protein n=1 Tax=Vibrio agarivorans TaxID=153622 RepID=UPI00222FFFD0|nr:hypothetical protein [Vibrio agarivorans]
MKEFLKDNWRLIAIVSTIFVGSWWIQSSITRTQLERSEIFSLHLEEFDKKLNEIGKKQTENFSKITTKSFGNFNNTHIELGVWVALA